jgi:hypothetical protein
MLNLAEPFAIVTVAGTRHQLSVAMMTVDFRGSAPPCGECFHADWDEIDMVMKRVGDLPMLTAGTGLVCLLRSSAMVFGVHDILDVSGDRTLTAMCERLKIPLGLSREPAIDAVLAIADIAHALVSGRASA